MQGERGGCRSKGKIPGTVEDAIEIKRKCESTCRNGRFYSRPALRLVVLPRELYMYIYISV